MPKHEPRLKRHLARIFAGEPPVKVCLGSEVQELEDNRQELLGQVRELFRGNTQLMERIIKLETKLKRTQKT